MPGEAAAFAPAAYVGAWDRKETQAVQQEPRDLCKDQDLGLILQVPGVPLREG